MKINLQSLLKRVRNARICISSDVAASNENATNFGNPMEEFCEKEKQDAIKEIKNGGLANCTYKQ